MRKALETWLAGLCLLGLVGCEPTPTPTPDAVREYGIKNAQIGLGLLAQTMRNLDQATAHFEDALAYCRNAGYRPELAWTCCDYADTLRERDGEGDRDKAMSLLGESLAISTELGMRPLMERVLSRREIPGTCNPIDHCSELNSVMS